MTYTTSSDDTNQPTNNGTSNLLPQILSNFTEEGSPPIPQCVFGIS